MTKRKVTEYKNILWELEAPLPTTIRVLQKYLKEYPDAWLDIDTETEYGVDVPVAYLSFEREETDCEYNERVEKEASNYDRKKKQYLKLKKEFEDVDDS